MDDFQFDKKNTTESSANGELLQLVSFRMENEEFGVDIRNVQEINRMMEVTRVPGSPPGIEGVVNLRGKVIPVMNLRQRLGLESKEHDQRTRIMVMELSERTVGFVVDAVNEVLRIPKSTTEPPPEMDIQTRTDFIMAVGRLDDRLLILLDLEKLLNESDRENLHLITDTV